MAQQIENGLWKLYIPLEGNPLKNLNSYLIRGERSLLIDTGFRWESCRSAMERELAETNINQDRIDIFVTHLHSDHAGLTPALLRPGCRAYISRIDGAGLVDHQDDGTWKRIYAAYVKEGFSPEEMEALWDSNPARSAAPDRLDSYTYLEDGDLLPYGGGLRCILTPGHTPGHMCLYDEARRWFFSGDHILFHITPNICRWEALPDALGSYLESLQKVQDLPVNLLLPAHREETGSLAARVDELTAHHRRRIEAACEAVQEEAGLTAYEIAGRMRWNIRSRSWAEFPLTQKFFAVGEALAHLDYLERRGRVERRESEGKCRYYVGGKEAKQE